MSNGQEYEVVGQMKFNQYDPGRGEVIEGWQVTYRDKFTGVTSKVFVPVSQYPQLVNEKIMSEIADIRLVHRMTGE